MRHGPPHTQILLLRYFCLNYLTCLDMSLADAGPDSDDANNNPDSKSQSEESMDFKDGDDVSKPCAKSFRLFTLHAVNSSGNRKVGDLDDNGKPIKFPS